MCVCGGAFLGERAGFAYFGEARDGMGWGRRIEWGMSPAAMLSGTCHPVLEPRCEEPVGAGSIEWGGMGGGTG